MTDRELIALARTLPAPKLSPARRAELAAETLALADREVPARRDARFVAPALVVIAAAAAVAFVIVRKPDDASPVSPVVGPTITAPTQPSVLVQPPLDRPSLAPR